MNIIKAQSPAGFAEEYIVESIWNGKFAPGSILPAERELSELIGVTRTTLREVLQRLARDGWLTIQHGKPTKVNNFWETSGLNILETLARLDQDRMPELVDQLLSAKTNISAVYIRAAIKNNQEKVLEALSKVEHMGDDPVDFAHRDYQLNHDLALASGNAIYVLTLNGFRSLYSKIASFYFSNPEARKIANNFYHKLKDYAKQGKHDEAVIFVRKYGLESGGVWNSMRKDIPADLMER
ncbi:fatty acid metabolism transcriptional regulator FadR [Algicola sagamiensis]|uniref:fatty acid metabolism transcriptional regulator FadR n=1 Tax=Algicola sagamiensis TaxID=163869 RepID=UPI00035C0CA4|nr:fatty acid metabolism transcriptional regulator FadR [Algicola sagamiensis]